MFVIIVKVLYFSAKVVKISIAEEYKALFGLYFSAIVVFGIDYTSRPGEVIPAYRSFSSILVRAKRRLPVTVLEDSLPVLLLIETPVTSPSISPM